LTNPIFSCGILEIGIMELENRQGLQLGSWNFRLVCVLMEDIFCYLAWLLKIK
jgi:hypothetical protein